MLLKPKLYRGSVVQPLAACGNIPGQDSEPQITNDCSTGVWVDSCQWVLGRVKKVPYKSKYYIHPAFTTVSLLQSFMWTFASELWQILNACLSLQTYKHMTSVKQPNSKQLQNQNQWCRFHSKLPQVTHQPSGHNIHWKPDSCRREDKIRANQNSRAQHDTRCRGEEPKVNGPSFTIQGSRQQPSVMFVLCRVAKE